MPGEAGVTGADLALDAITRRGTGTVYLGLATAAITDATDLSTVAEVSDTNYARQAVAWTAPADAAGVRETHNAALESFPNGGSLGFATNVPSVTHCFLTTVAAAASGAIEFYWTLDTARDPAIGDKIEFAIGALVIQLD